jgi:hypothetical protein
MRYCVTASWACWRWPCARARVLGRTPPRLFSNQLQYRGLQRPFGSDFDAF